MNYTQLVTAIQDYVESEETSFLAHIDDFIALAEERVYRLVKVPAQRAVYEGAFTSGVATVPAPPGFLAVDAFSVTDVAGQVHYLLPKEWGFIKEAYPSTASGTPRFYTLQDDHTLYVVPTPSSALALEMAYMVKPDSIVTAGTTWIGSNASVALLYACLIEAYTYLKGEDNIIARYEARFQEAIGGAKVLGEGRDKKDEWRNPVTRAPT